MCIEFELIRQVEAALELVDVAYGVIAPGFPDVEAPVQVASVQTLVRPHRLDQWRDKFDLIVVDEAHHAVAAAWSKVFASQPQARMLGVTATPERLDGRGLGEIFDSMVIGPSTAEVIAAGWLSRFAVYEPIAPDLSEARIRAGDFAVEDIRSAIGGVVIQSAVDEYKRRCMGTPAVAFCVDLARSEAVTERFREAGVRAQHVDGETPPAERPAGIAALGSGDLDVITNCGLISEGVDVPAIGAAVLLRPTASLALYLQQVGRVLRPAPGKDRSIIFDFSGNVVRQGMPGAPREWSLYAKPRRQREHADGLRLLRCDACGALNRADAHACSECGVDLRTPKERVEVEIALQEARRDLEDSLVRMPFREQKQWAGADEGRLGTVARVNGYRPGWVYFRLKELAGQSRAAA